jgi:enamine deaminase RidA (YjgF/YER057c/UK114 family)
MPSQRNATYSEKVSKHEAKSSHVIRAGGLLHVTGWMGDVPETGKIIDGGIEAQAVRYLKTSPHILRRAHGKLHAD